MNYFKIVWLLFLIVFLIHLLLGQGYTVSLTGSSKFAELGQAFTWTCEVAPEQPEQAVKYYRNEKLCAAVGFKDGTCIKQTDNYRYTYDCLTGSRFTLTIPAENLTEDEQGSVWRCLTISHSSVNSSTVTLEIASKIYSHV